MQGDFPAEKMIQGLSGVDPARKARLLEVLDIDPAWRMHTVSDGQRRRVQLLLGLLHPFKVHEMPVCTGVHDCCLPCSWQCGCSQSKVSNIVYSCKTSSSSLAATLSANAATEALSVSTCNALPTVLVYVWTTIVRTQASAAGPAAQRCISNSCQLLAAQHVLRAVLSAACIQVTSAAWAQVLLLDEITVDLDVLGRADLLAFLREECEQRRATIIYVRPASLLLDKISVAAARQAHSGRRT